MSKNKPLSSFRWLRLRSCGKSGKCEEELSGNWGGTDLRRQEMGRFLPASMAI
ncbi:MAG: hypothetical protein ACP5VS_12680 [Desulfomonilaceae bacterium]